MLCAWSIPTRPGRDSSRNRNSTTPRQKTVPRRRRWMRPSHRWPPPNSSLKLPKPISSTIPRSATTPISRPPMMAWSPGARDGIASWWPSQSRTICLQQVGGRRRVAKVGHKMGQFWAQISLTHMCVICHNWMVEKAKVKRERVETMMSAQETRTRIFKVGYHVLTVIAMAIAIAVGYNQLRIWQHSGQSYMSELLRVVLIFVFAACVLGGGVFHFIALRLEKKGSRTQEREATESPKLEPKLKIHRALWGAGPQAEVSVTNELQNCPREALVIRVDHDLGGLTHDPAFAVQKSLEIDYSYGSDTLIHVSRLEPPAGQTMRLVLPEDSEIERLASALRNKDVECEEKLLLALSQQRASQSLDFGILWKH